MKNMEARGGNIEVNSISLTQNSLHHKGAQKKNELNFDLERPAIEDTAELLDSDGVLEIINEAEIELTLGPSSYNCKKVIETQLTSDSGHSLSSYSTGSGLINKTRCRTHHSSHRTREEMSGDIIGLVQVPHSTSGCQNGKIRNSYDIEEQSRPERSKQPPWLFQVLSLSTT